MFSIQPLMDLKRQIDADILQMDRLDRFLLRRMFQRGWLDRRRHNRVGGQSVLVLGDIFVQMTLPFCDLFPHGNGEFQFVRPDDVLAGKYREIEDVDLDRASSIADYLDKESEQDGLDVAHYLEIAPFSLVVAGEGKNRVDLYTRLGRKIAARVRRCHYPAARELELVEVKPWGQVALIYKGIDPSVHHRLRQVQILQRNIAALPFAESVWLLESYGVKWGRPIWSFKGSVVGRNVRLFVCRHWYKR